MSKRESTDAKRQHGSTVFLGPTAPAHTYGFSSTAPDSFNCWCSCGWIETGWPQERDAAASLSAHLGSNHGRVRTVPGA